jgi:hypothetical protein
MAGVLEKIRSLAIIYGFDICPSVHVTKVASKGVISLEGHPEFRETWNVEYR